MQGSNAKRLEEDLDDTVIRRNCAILKAARHQEAETRFVVDLLCADNIQTTSIRHAHVAQQRIEWLVLFFDQGECFRDIGRSSHDLTASRKILCQAR